MSPSVNGQSLGWTSADQGVKSFIVHNQQKRSAFAELFGSGQLLTRTIPRGVYGYGYDPVNGALETIEAPNGGILSLDYDGSLLAQSTWTGTVFDTVPEPRPRFPGREPQRQRRPRRGLRLRSGRVPLAGR